MLSSNGGAGGDRPSIRDNGSADDVDFASDGGALRRPDDNDADGVGLQRFDAAADDGVTASGVDCECAILMNMSKRRSCREGNDSHT